MNIEVHTGGSERFGVISFEAENVAERAQLAAIKAELDSQLVNYFEWKNADSQRQGISVRTKLMKDV